MPVCPRIVNVALSDPGCPLDCTAATPAIRAPTMLLILIVGALSNSLSDTVEIAPVILPRF